jgi:hypothetical protein
MTQRLPHDDGLVSSIKKQSQVLELRKKTIVPVIILLTFLSLGGLGFYCVFKGGSVILQVRDFILTFSGQAQSN